MRHITSTIELKNAIQRLEFERDFEGQKLKEDFQYAYKSLNPFNMLRGTIDQTTTTPQLIENMIGTVLGLMTGYLTKKIIIGKSGNKLRVLIGSVIQFGILNFMAQRSDTFTSIKQFLVKSFFKKKQI